MTLLSALIAAEVGQFAESFWEPSGSTPLFSQKDSANRPTSAYLV